MNEKPTGLRQSLIDAISGHQAHIAFDSVITDFPTELQGEKLAGAPHTAWQLLEHLRIAQWDILEFSKGEAHKSPKWPDDYWPKEDAPPDDKAWDKTVAQFRKDNREMIGLIQDESRDLLAPFPHGEGQTLLREALLIANHNSYHLGELVFLKKQLAGRS